MDEQPEPIQEAPSAGHSPDLTRPVKKHGGGPARSKEERDVFNADVARLRIDGMTFDNIAKTLKCAKATAHAGYKTFMADYHKHHASSSKVLLSEYIARKERIYRNMLAAYSATIPAGKTVGDIKLLERAGAVLDESFDREQSAGLIAKAKDKLELEGTVGYKFTIVRRQDGRKNP